MGHHTYFTTKKPQHQIYLIESLGFLALLKFTDEPQADSSFLGQFGQGKLYCLALVLYKF